MRPVAVFGRDDRADDERCSGHGSELTALGENYLAASLLAGLPVALVYLLFQRRVTQAVMLSSGLWSR